MALNVITLATCVFTGNGKPCMPCKAFAKGHKKEHFSLSVSEYLTLLVGHDLLVHENGNQTYVTTEKGKRLLKLCSKMDESI